VKFVGYPVLLRFKFVPLRWRTVHFRNRVTRIPFVVWS
jgi:hypothetical protein